MDQFLILCSLTLIAALGASQNIPPIPPYWFFTSYCSDTPVLNYWDASLFKGEWSVVRFAAPYTTNTLPLPTCGRIEITGDTNETKTWSVSFENEEGELVTSVKETKATSLEISSGRWVLSDYGVYSKETSTEPEFFIGRVSASANLNIYAFPAHDQYSMKPLSSLLFLGYTRTEVEHYDTILFASCTYIHVPMGNPQNRIGEFGILVRKGTEDLYDESYFRLHYEYVLEIAQLGTIEDMTAYSHEQCIFK